MLGWWRGRRSDPSGLSCRSLFRFLCRGAEFMAVRAAHLAGLVDFLRYDPRAGLILPARMLGQALAWRRRILIGHRFSATCHRCIRLRSRVGFWNGGRRGSFGLRRHRRWRRLLRPGDGRTCEQRKRAGCRRAHCPADKCRHKGHLQLLNRLRCLVESGFSLNCVLPVPSNAS